MWSISQDNRVIDITNVRIETFVPLKMSDPPASILLLEKRKVGQKMTYEKFHPICPTCGHVDPEGWNMICPIDKTYKVRQVLTFDENLNLVR